MKYSNNNNFNRLCYIIDTFNSFIRQAHNMSQVYYFLQYIRSDLQNSHPSLYKYNINNIDKDIDTLQKSMQNLYKERVLFVKNNTSDLISSIKELQYFHPKKNKYTHMYSLYFNDEIIPYSNLEYYANNYLLSQHITKTK